MARYKHNGYDIVLGGPDAPPLAVSAETTNYLFVQLSGDKDRPTEYDLLRAKNCFPLERVGDALWLCRYDPSDLSPLRQLNFVTLVDIYHPFLKIRNDPGLRVGRDPTPLDNTLPSDGFAVSSSPTRRVDVIVGLHVDARQRPEPIRELVAKLIADGIMDQSEAWYYIAPDLEHPAPYITTNVSIDQLSTIAAYDVVHQITRSAPVVFDDEEQRNICLDSFYDENFTDGTPYTGAGQVIHVHDSGFDTGSMSDPHPAFDTARIAGLYNRYLPHGQRGPLNAPSSQQGPLNDQENHGTGVIGVAVGNGFSQSMADCAENHGKSGKIRGIAPGARFVSTRSSNPSGDTGRSDFMHSCRTPYHAHGARISNHSWGISPGDQTMIGYGPDAASIDNAIFYHDDLLAVFSAGNRGKRGVRGTIAWPAICKNTLVVGMSFSTRPLSILPTGPVQPDDFAIGDYSSCGPTTEGRLKPDMVAPGYHILAPSSRHARSVSTPQSPDLYRYRNGTSFAAPVVAGCAALVREALASQLNNSSPSAALMKALLINGCVKMKGFPGDVQTDLPNAASGFGRVNIGGSMKSIATLHNPDLNQFVDRPVTFRLGQRYTRTLIIPSPPALYSGGPTVDQTFKVTLVWTDKPGPDLQFRLGLVVIDANAQRRYGNSDWENTTDEDRFFDTINNVQQVTWRCVPPGLLRIEVVCLKLANDHDIFNKWALAWSFE